MKKQSGFMLLEAVCAMAVLGAAIVVILTGLTFAWQTRQMSRDGLLATQLLIDRTEILRLCNWEQILAQETNSPVAFAENRAGLDFTGTMTIGPSELPASYANALRKVTFVVDWKTGNLSRTRTWMTLVAEQGLQGYIY